MREPGYDVAQVCLNGHIVTTTLKTTPTQTAPYCDECGEKTISQCPECKSGIRGRYQSDWGTGWSPVTPPAHCFNCGAPMPWTERKAAAAAAVFDELEELTEFERQGLTTSVPDLMTETANSPVAILRFKKAIAKVTGIGRDVLTKLIADIAATAIKKEMGL